MLAQLQKQVFFRGGLLLLVADSPQRALMCYCKHPNSSSKFPCIYCMVMQTPDNDGGPLGDSEFDIVANKRTRGLIREGREKLSALSGSAVAQAELSKDLGIVAPLSSDDKMVLDDSMDCDPLRMTPCEILHADSLVIQIEVSITVCTSLLYVRIVGAHDVACDTRLACSRPAPTTPSTSLHFYPPICYNLAAGGASPIQNAQALVQKFLLGLLNKRGNAVVTAVMRQRGGNNLYPAGVSPLKDIVNDYSSLTGR